MYESKQRPPLSPERFRSRLFLHVLGAAALIGGSLGLGVSGYVLFEELSFLDALLDSSMLLGGMGPVHAPVTPGGKLFASFYALYAGLVFIVTAALLFTPVAHRLLHKFHWEESGTEGEPETNRSQ